MRIPKRLSEEAPDTKEKKKMNRNDVRPDWDLETSLPLITGDFISPHYRWTRTGPTTLTIFIQDDEHRTTWTIEPDISGMWVIDDSQGVPLSLISTEPVNRAFTEPGRAMDVLQELAEGLLRIWDQEIEGRIIEKRTRLLDIELSFRGVPTEIQEIP